MLILHLKPLEKWNYDTEMFEYEGKETELKLEHSLISISKWESKWHKPFLGTEKSNEETKDYIKCMTIGNVEDKVYRQLTSKEIKLINDYIEDPMTATTFRTQEGKGTGKNGVVTSELIYYWMVSFGIPSEYEKWHISRLLTLLRICSVKNQPPKKMSKSAMRDQNRALNNARRAKLGTKG